LAFQCAVIYLLIVLLSLSPSVVLIYQCCGKALSTISPNNNPSIIYNRRVTSFIQSLSTIILLRNIFVMHISLLVVVVLVVRLLHELLKVDLVPEQSADTTKALDELGTLGGPVCDKLQLGAKVLVVLG
jgi:hypothetical protein